MSLIWIDDDQLLDNLVRCLCELFSDTRADGG